MANVGSGTAGQTYIGAGNGASGTYKPIGTNSGLSTHGVLLGQGLNAFNAVVPAAVGTVLMSNGPGVDPSFQSGGTVIANTITGNSGGSLSPIGGNWNILGTGSITTSGSGATLTTQLTGLTNHSVLLGAGTATITSLTNGTTGQILGATTSGNPSWVNTFQGSTTGVAPAAGYIGEYITSYAGTTSITNSTPTTITSITLSAGVWNIVANGQVNTNGVTTGFQIGISTVTNSFTPNTGGDNTSQIFDNTTLFSGGGVISLTVPDYRVNLASPTTYYLVGEAYFSTLGSTTSGRISATRVG